MKKILLGLALSFFFFSSASAAEFNKNLRFGSKGNEVKKLQEFLTEQNLYSGPITGNFFSLTLKAVKSFQSANSVSPASGYFGPLTRTKANEILDSQLADQNAEAADEPVIEPKTTDDVVSKLNEQIGALNNQNQLLQQIVDQTKPITPIVNEPVVAPVLNPNVTAQRLPSPLFDGLANKAVLEITTQDDSFLIEAIAVSVENKPEFRSAIYPGTGFITPSDVWRRFDLQFRECTGLESIFQEYSKIPYPYPCEGKEYADNSDYIGWNSAVRNGYGFSLKDWMGRKTYLADYPLEKNKSYKIYLNSPAKFDYIKLVGQETGKVIELRDL